MNGEAGTSNYGDSGCARMTNVEYRRGSEMWGIQIPLIAKNAMNGEAGTSNYGDSGCARMTNIEYRRGSEMGGIQILLIARTQHAWGTQSPTHAEKNAA